AVEGGLRDAAGDAARVNFDQEEMIIGAAADDAESAACDARGERLRVGDDLLLVGAKLRLHGFLQADGFGGDDVHQRAALNAGERGAVEVLCIFFAAENQAAARAAQRLVRGGGDKIGV